MNLNADCSVGTAQHMDKAARYSVSMQRRRTYAVNIQAGGTLEIRKRTRCYGDY